MFIFRHYGGHCDEHSCRQAVAVSRRHGLRPAARKAVSAGKPLIVWKLLLPGMQNIAKTLCRRRGIEDCRSKVHAPELSLVAILHMLPTLRQQDIICHSHQAFVFAALVFSTCQTQGPCLTARCCEVPFHAAPCLYLRPLFRIDHKKHDANAGSLWISSRTVYQHVLTCVNSQPPAGLGLG